MSEQNLTEPNLENETSKKDEECESQSPTKSIEEKDFERLLEASEVLDNADTNFGCLKNFFFNPLISFLDELPIKFRG